VLMSETVTSPDRALLGTPHQNLGMVTRVFPSGVPVIPYKRDLGIDSPLDLIPSPALPDSGITAGEIL